MANARARWAWATALAWAGVVALGTQAALAAETAGGENLLTMGAGATVVRAAPTMEASAFVAIDGNDGTTSVGTPRRQPLPHVFVVELPALTTLRRFEVPPINEFGSARGRHIKHLEIEASTTSPDAGFSPLLSIELVAGVKAAQSFDVPTPRAVRWVRVRFVDTFTPAPYDAAPHAFSDLRAFGTQEAIAVADDAFTGRWRLRRKGINDEAGRNIIELWQHGAFVAGCQRMGGQQMKLSGTIVDGLARLVATAQQGHSAPLTARIASDGQLTGVNFAGPPRAFYAAPAPDAEAPCRPPPGPANPIEEALSGGQVAIVHGIHFDTDKDVLRPDAKPALEQLLAALTGAPGLSVIIEGHTDAQGADDHNLDLSDRRAKSVVAWLVARGVAASRLTPTGKGESEPMADNASSAGRALNRRVEVEPRK